MSAVEQFTPQALFLTDNAVAKVKSLVDAEANDALKLRVFVTGGGCSGFSYGFTFDEIVAEDDTCVEKEGYCFVRPDELSIFSRSGSGLSRGFGRFPFRGQ